MNGSATGSRPRWRHLSKPARQLGGRSRRRRFSPPRRRLCVPPPRVRPPPLLWRRRARAPAPGGWDPWTQGYGGGVRPASQARQRRPSVANVLRPRHHRETAHEQTQPSWDCHWSRVVDEHHHDNSWPPRVRHEPQARAGYQERDQQHVLGTLTGEFCSAIAPRTMTLGNVRELGVRALPGNG